jgi:hypothetical protein
MPMNVKHRRSGKNHFSVHEELVLGELKATIFLHQVEDRAMPCWCYATEGFRRYKHREIAFTLVRKPDEKVEDYPKEPLEVFQKLYRDAKDGWKVTVGHITPLEGEGMLGFAGVAFLDTQGAGGLAMIGLLSEELKCIEEFGAQRMFSLLGKAERFFPAPYWTERGRPSRGSLKEMESSVLYTVKRIHESGFCVFREAGRVVMRARLGYDSNAALRRIADPPRDQPLALLTEMHPDCDGALKWDAGLIIPSASVAPGSKGARICGSFVVLRPNQPEDSARILEDGYVLALTAPNWERMREALMGKKDLVLPTCELQWTEQEDQWPARSWRRRMMVKAGDSEEQMLTKVEPRLLAGLIGNIEQEVLDVFQGDWSIGELRVMVEIESKQMPRYQLERKGALDDVSMRRLAEQLQNIPGPFVKETISFMLEFDIGVRRGKGTAASK